MADFNYQELDSDQLSSTTNVDDHSLYQDLSFPRSSAPIISLYKKMNQGIEKDD